MRMTKAIKRIFLTIFSAVFCFALSLSIGFFSPIKAKAAVVETTDMYCDGASVRLSSDGRNGIRFHVRVNAMQDGSVTLDGVEYSREEFYALTTGILMMPADKLADDEALTIEGATTRYKSGALAANVTGEQCVWSWKNNEGSYFYEATAYVYNIPENSFDRQFVFRGYYTLDGTNYVYTKNTEKSCRSVSYVALKAKLEDNAQKDLDAEAGYQDADLNALNEFLPITKQFKQTETYLYRVGNQNAVPVSALFAMTEEVDNKIYEILDIECSSNTVSMEVADDNKSVQFSGTGVATLTISKKYCDEATKLSVEVIEAVNATSAIDAKENNVVLLNDIGAGSLTISGGHTFYGNGFKVSFSGDGSYRAQAVSYGFITIEKGGVLDNTQVVCKIFPKSYLYTTEMTVGSDGRYPYSYSAIVISGNSTISNCYIYGARNNIQVGEGNVTIENTVTECGSLSNIHVKSGDAYTVTLKDVTTIQYVATSSFDASAKVLGFGILFGDNDSSSNAKLRLEGYLKQYNWVTNAHTSSSNVSNSYARTAIGNALKETSYQHTANGATTINMGIVYLNEKTASITDNRTDKATAVYALKTISMSTYKGQVYSLTNGGNTSKAPVYGAVYNETYAPNTNRDILPTLSFADTNSAITCVSGYNVTTGAWDNSLQLDLDTITGRSYNVYFNKLKVQKHGEDLSFTVKDENGNTVNKDTAITFNKLETKNYTLIVSDHVRYNAEGEFAGSKTLEIPFAIKSTMTSIAPPKFTNASTAVGIKLVTSKGGDWRPAYEVLKGVTVTYWSASQSKVVTVDLNSLYNKGTISNNVWTYTCNDYTLTITGGQVHSDGTKITPVVSNNTLYFASTNKAFGTGTASRSIILTYEFTDKNASTMWSRTETVTHSGLTEYDYNKFKNGTLEEAGSGSGCVTPDTLITLANGTQVRVDSLKGNEQLLVWNMETGKLDSAPIMFLDSEPASACEVVRLYFSDGTSVNVIYEHGFWDYDLNKYVYLDENAADYIGHTFAKQKGDSLEKVQLVDVVIEEEYTTAWSPVTKGHLCYFVNGMLSMPGGVGGLFNIFEVDAETMTYDYEAIARDIELYGLFTYEELNAIVELPQSMFNEAGGMYMKISIAKGNMTMEELITMINRYRHFYE